MLFFSHKCGQLGNRLFAYAHFISFAHHYRLKVANLAFDEYARYFETTHQDVLCRYPAKPTAVTSNLVRTIAFTINRALLKLFRIIKFRKSFVHSVVVADLPEYQFEESRFFELDTDSFVYTARKTPVVLLFGRFFRDYSHFQQYQDIIRSYFRPLSSIQGEIDGLIARARIQNHTLVGVHIRRGDYREFKGGKYFFEQFDYRKKLEELQRNHPQLSFCFLICSNEKINGKIFHDLPNVIGLGSLVEDMYSLAACDLIIGPPSTFTRWASFYGKVPLFQLEDLDRPVYISQFEILPPQRLYNF